MHFFHDYILQHNVLRITFSVPYMGLKIGVLNGQVMNGELFQALNLDSLLCAYTVNVPHSYILKFRDVLHGRLLGVFVH